MTALRSIEGQMRVENAYIGIVAARFNGFIVDHLIQGAVDVLQREGVDDAMIELVRTPGAYELPLAAKAMARRGSYDALIALGCVIRGATPHFEYVAGECARGLSQVGLEFDIPVAFGVLTTDTLEQAIERAGTKGGNKGAEAAQTALEMVSLLRKLSS